MTQEENKQTYNFDNFKELIEKFDKDLKPSNLIEFYVANIASEQFSKEAYRFFVALEVALQQNIDLKEKCANLELKLKKIYGMHREPNINTEIKFEGDL